MHTAIWGRTCAELYTCHVGSLPLRLVGSRVVEVELPWELRALAALPFTSRRCGGMAPGGLLGLRIDIEEPRGGRPVSAAPGHLPLAWRCFSQPSGRSPPPCAACGADAAGGAAGGAAGAGGSTATGCGTRLGASAGRAQLGGASLLKPVSSLK